MREGLLRLLISKVTTPLVGLLLSLAIRYSLLPFSKLPYCWETAVVFLARSTGLSGSLMSNVAKPFASFIEIVIVLPTTHNEPARKLVPSSAFEIVFFKTGLAGL